MPEVTSDERAKLVPRIPVSIRVLRAPVKARGYHAQQEDRHEGDSGLLIPSVPACLLRRVDHRHLHRYLLFEGVLFWQILSRAQHPDCLDVPFLPGFPSLESRCANCWTL